MKSIRRNIRLISFVLVGSLLALIIYGAYSISTLGTRWFTSSANIYAYRIKSNVIAGSIFDRNQVPLAITDAAGNRVYHQNAQIRSAVVHAVGDKANNVAHGAESFMSRYLYGFNDSYVDRVLGAIRGEKRRGNDIVLSLTVRCMRTLPAFPKVKAGQ